MISPFNQAWLNNFPTVLIMRVKQWFDDLCRQVNTSLTAIASMPAISTQNVVTGSRSFGLSYHNTTGRPMFVEITVYGVGASGNALAYTDSASTPGTPVAYAGGIVGSGYNVLSFWVIPGNYYRVTNTPGVTIGIWTEWY